MSFDTAKILLDAVVAFNRVKNGDSGDAEHDAGVELQDAAIAHLRDGIDGSAEMDAFGTLLASYGDTLDNDVEEES